MNPLLCKAKDNFNKEHTPVQDLKDEQKIITCFHCGQTLVQAQDFQQYVDTQIQTVEKIVSEVLDNHTVKRYY